MLFKYLKICLAVCAGVWGTWSVAAQSFKVKIAHLENNNTEWDVVLECLPVDGGVAVVAFKGEDSQGNDQTALFGNLSNPVTIEIPPSVKYDGREYRVVGWGSPACDLEHPDSGAGMNPPGDKVTIKLPASVNCLGWKCFSQYASPGAMYSSLDLSAVESVTTVWPGAFYGMTFPDDFDSGIFDDVTEVGSLAFYGTNLKKVNLKGNVCYIGDKAFYGATQLEEVFVNSSSSTSYIGLKAFSGNDESIKKAEIHIARIGKEAFKDCKFLQVLALGRNVRQIGPSAFDGCVRLNEIHLGSTIPPECNENAFRSVGSFNSTGGTVVHLDLDSEIDGLEFLFYDMVTKQPAIRVVRRNVAMDDGPPLWLFFDGAGTPVDIKTVPRSNGSEAETYEIYSGTILRLESIGYAAFNPKNGWVNTRIIDFYADGSLGNQVSGVTPWQDVKVCLPGLPDYRLLRRYSGSKSYSSVDGSVYEPLSNDLSLLQGWEKSHVNGCLFYIDPSTGEPYRNSDGLISIQPRERFWENGSNFWLTFEDDYQWQLTDDPGSGVQGLLLDVDFAAEFDVGQSRNLYANDVRLVNTRLTKNGETGGETNAFLRMRDIIFAGEERIKPLTTFSLYRVMPGGTGSPDNEVDRGMLIATVKLIERKTIKIDGLQDQVGSRYFHEIPFKVEYAGIFPPEGAVTEGYLYAFDTSADGAGNGILRSDKGYTLVSFKDFFDRRVESRLENDRYCYYVRYNALHWADAKDVDDTDCLTDESAVPMFNVVPNLDFKLYTADEVSSDTDRHLGPNVIEAVVDVMYEPSVVKYQLVDREGTAIGSPVYTSDLLFDYDGRTAFSIALPDSFDPADNVAVRISQLPDYWKYLNREGVDQPQPGSLEDGIDASPGTGEERYADIPATLLKNHYGSPFVSSVGQLPFEFSAVMNKVSNWGDDGFITKKHLAVSTDDYNGHYRLMNVSHYNIWRMMSNTLGMADDVLRMAGGDSAGELIFGYGSADSYNPGPSATPDGYSSWAYGTDRLRLDHTDGYTASLDLIGNIAYSGRAYVAAYSSLNTSYADDAPLGYVMVNKDVVPVYGGEIAGVEDVSADIPGRLLVRLISGGVEVDASSAVTVHNVGGQAVYRSSDAGVHTVKGLAPGCYIVSADGLSSKVIVR